MVVTLIQHFNIGASAMDPMNNEFHLTANSIFDTNYRRMSFLDAPLDDSLIVNKVEKSSGINQKVSFFLFTLNIVEEGMVCLLTRNFP